MAVNQRPVVYATHRERGGCAPIKSEVCAPPSRARWVRPHRERGVKKKRSGAVWWVDVVRRQGDSRLKELSTKQVNREQRTTEAEPDSRLKELSTKQVNREQRTTEAEPVLVSTLLHQTSFTDECCFCLEVKVVRYGPVLRTSKRFRAGSQNWEERTAAVRQHTPT
ncbi:hypothetical protein NQZ68_038608 [Dissostichus eleginoides]|nr:hypothetical protein NQZ68_038608 [Dissostichus eleginoides]